MLHPLDDTLDWERLPGRPAIERPATTADAIELVAAGVGLLLVPQSLARLHHRKDLTYRPVTDAPESRIALSWPEDRTTDLVEDFIGIVRGRTVNSSRGRATTPAQPKGKRPEAGSARRKPPAGQGDRQEPAKRIRRIQGRQARKASPQVVAARRTADRAGPAAAARIHRCS